MSQKRESVARLEELREAIGRSALMHTSQKGVPHLVVQLVDGCASVVYFARQDRFRVFRPYPSYGMEQSRYTASSREGVMIHLRQLGIADD